MRCCGMTSASTSSSAAWLHLRRGTTSTTSGTCSSRCSSPWGRLFLRSTFRCWHLVPHCGCLYAPGGTSALARPGRPRIQPHPRRRHPDRPPAGQGDHGHHPPNPGRRARPGGVLGPAATPAPAHELALATGLEATVRHRLRTTPVSQDLTTQPATARPRTCTWNTPTARSGDPLRPVPRIAYAARNTLLNNTRRWIEA